jgi:hypothetical protein
MLGDEILDRPALLVPAAVAVGADDRDLAMALEECERHLPDLAVLLIHGGVMVRADRARVGASLGHPRRNKLSGPQQFAYAFARFLID